MKNKHSLKFALLLIVLIAGLVFVAGSYAQQYGRPPQRGGGMQGGPQFTRPMGPKPVAMVVSPDSKYLYLFHLGSIRQYELPALKLINTVEVVEPGKARSGEEQ